MTRHLRLAFRLVGVVLVWGCTRLPSESGSRRPIAVSFTRADAITAFPANYISVLDTAVLDVTQGTSPTQSYRVRVGQLDSTARFAVELDNGPVVLVATIISNNGTRLFTGRLPTTVRSDTDSLTISVQPISPVLLLSLNFAVRDNGGTRSFTTRVHNRGSGTLQWNVAATPPGCASVCTFTPPGGVIAADSSVQLVISAPSTAFPAPPRATLASASGRVTIP
jgi:hypothetical protein